MSIPGNTVSILDPQIPVDQGIFEESSEQKARLGTRLSVGDRVFRYARLATSANAAAGQLLCVPTVIASHQDNILTISAQTTGGTFLTCSASAGNEWLANQYAEGYVTVGSTGLGGGGQMFRIKSHASGASSAFYLYDSIPGTVAAGPGSLTPCLYNKVLQGNAVTDLAAGVAPIAVTTSNYFWLQTWGPCGVKASTAIGAGIGVAVGVSGGVQGLLTIGAITAGGTPIGKCIGVSVESHAFPVYLTIAP